MTDNIFQVGELIENRYRVLSVIGRGGMGTLYRVLDEIKDGEIIALKTVRLNVPVAEAPACETVRGGASYRIRSRAGQVRSRRT